MAAFLTTPSGPGGQSVEWYTGPSAGGAAPASTGNFGDGQSYSGGYSPVAGGKIGGGEFGAAGQYGSFEDEPPLLEG